MKKNIEENYKRIYWVICDDKESDFATSCITFPIIDNLKEDYLTKNEILIDFIEQLILENLKNIENELKLDCLEYKNIKSKMKILKRNLKFKSPIYVNENLFEV